MSHSSFWMSTYVIIEEYGVLAWNGHDLLIKPTSDVGKILNHLMLPLNIDTKGFRNVFDWIKLLRRSDRSVLLFAFGDVMRVGKDSLVPIQHTKTRPCPEYCCLLYDNNMLHVLS